MARRGPRVRDLRLPRRPGRAARALVLLFGLLVTGGLYVLLVPQARHAAAEGGPPPSTGQRLYETNCMSCHGADLRGIPRRGPGIAGTGEAAVYFQVSTGRMPRARNSGVAQRKPPVRELDPKTAEGRANLLALGAYVQERGGGPRLPAEHGGALVGRDTAEGGQLFRANCATCHNFTGRGGPMPGRKFAPWLRESGPEQLYTAMLTGPQDMPVFGDRDLTPGQKKDIIGYVLSVRGQRNAPGGFDLGEIGPVTEGFSAFAVGLATLFFIAVWLGARL